MCPPLWTSLLVAMYDDIKNIFILANLEKLRFLFAGFYCKQCFFVAAPNKDNSKEISFVNVEMSIGIQDLHAQPSSVTFMDVFSFWLLR